MSTFVNSASYLLRRFSPSPIGLLQKPASHLLLQSRGIRVKVLNGNLDQALTFMQRAMVSRHYKKSEKRVLAKKALEKRLRSQEMLKSILVQKVILILERICDERYIIAAA